MNGVLKNDIMHGCAVFDGSIAKSTRPITTSFDPVGYTAITVEYWGLVKSHTHYGSPISNFSIAGTATGIAAYVDTANVVRVCIGDGTPYDFSNKHGHIFTVPTIAINTWYHIATTLQGNTITLYINGVLIGTMQTKSSTVKLDSRAFILGRWATDYNDYIYNGSVDEIRIWNYARTATQIKDNYKKSIQPEAGLVAYYKLDGNALDSSGNGNYGTVNGGVSWSVDGKLPVSQVAVFDGVGNGIDVPALFPTESSAVTLEAFVYKSKVGTDWQMICSPYIFGYIAFNLGKAYFSIAVNGNQQHTIFSPTNVPDNTWLHLSYTYDGTTFRGYVNGIQVTSKAVTGLMAASTANTVIGRYAGNSLWLGGMISYVRVWDKVLTTTELSSNATKVLPTTTPNLKQQHVLNGSTTGTLVGGTKFIVDTPNLIADVSTELEKTKLLTSKFKLGSAVFDGGNSISIPYGSGVSTTGGITVECWFKDISTDGNRIFLSSGQNPDNRFYLGRPSTTANVTLGLGNKAWQPIGSITLNTWTHVAISLTDRTALTYINGVYVNTITSDTPITLVSNFVLGMHSNAYRFQGSLSDVRIWNYARTATQIRENYKRVLQPQAGLAAYYRLNGNVLDTSGNGNNGTETNVGYSVDGYVPATRVANFDGTGNVDYPSVTVPTTGYTMECWVLSPKTANGTALQIFMNKTGNYMSFYTDGRPWFSLMTTENGATQHNLSGPAPSLKDNTWYHFTATYDGAMFRGYINGLQVGSKAVTGEVYQYGTPLKFGRYSSGNSYPFTGSIGTARVWSKALTQKEILDNMYKVLPGSTTGLLEQWTFNNTFNGTNGNNGTATGGVTFVPDTPKGLADVSSAVDKSAILLSKSKNSQPTALDFTNNQYIDLPNDIGYTDSFSAFGWIKLRTTAAGNHHILFGGMELEISIPTVGSPSPVGSLRVGVYNSTRTVQNFGSGLLDGAWHFVGTTYSDRKLTAYIDGVEVGNFTVSGTTALRTSFVRRIGRWGTDIQYYMNGLVGDIIMYNRALPPNEVLKLMSSSTSVKNGLILLLQPKPTDLIGILDLSGKGNNGTYTGTITPVTSTAPVGQRSGLKITNDVIDYGSNTAYDVQEFTVEGWIRVDHTRTGTVTMLRKTNGANNWISVGKNGNNFIIGVYASNGGGQTSSFDFTTYYGKWVHAAFQYSNITGVMSIIINGALAYSRAITPFAAGWNTGGNLQTYHSSGSNTAYGYLRYYDKVIPLADIQKNMYSYIPANTPNLVEQWKLNEGVGATIYGDNGNNGTITGTATWTTPSLMNWRNKVAMLDTTNGNYIDLTRILPTLTKQVTSTATFEFWIKPNKSHLATSGVGAPIIQFNASGTNGSAGQQFGVWYGDVTGSIVDEVISIALFKNFTSAYLIKGFRNSSDIYVNNWFHVAVVLTPTAWTCYINGVQITLTSSAGNISEGGCLEDISSTLVNGFLGQRNVNYQKFDGSVDELRVWNVARTATEIADNYQRSIGRHHNLVLNYTFDSGLTFDSSGNNNHGTVVGTVINEDSDNDKLLFNAPINE